MPETRTTTLFSLATIRDHCRCGATNHDAALVRIADRVSECVDAHIRRPFVSRTIVERRDGTGTQQLPLRAFPVQSITEAKYRLSLLDAWTVAGPTEYELDGVRGYLYLTQWHWPRVIQGAEVTYVAGFGAKDAASLPADVVGAALDFVKFVYDRWKSDTVTLGSLNLSAAGSAVVVPGLPKDVLDTLEPYVKRRL